jgi:aminopeptidase N
MPSRAAIAAATVAAACAAAACSGGAGRPGGADRAQAAGPAPPAPEAAVLQRADAEARAQIVGAVDYDLALDLSAPGDRYRGRVALELAITAPGRDLRVDFAAGGAVTAVALDGRALAARRDPQSLTIPGAALAAGAHRLEISFEQAYSRDSRGLTRFVDPADRTTYLYTDLEPYAANRAFPCLDQPDLKATFALEVTVPRRWQVITAVREASVTPRGDAAVWRFPRGPRHSTYVFPLHAGDYASWEDATGPVPLRLFARRSLAAHVQPAEWLSLARHGLAFFARYFATPFPYAKYDQIIVPELGNEAMENVAAVTFHERLVSRGESSAAQRRARADSILHELAHMWFGNLVTMRWWGDLWLNESFATYMAQLALAAHPGFEGSRQALLVTKQWAYEADELVTTHPVVTPAADTDEVEASFDDITYGKAAALLDQLAFVLGEDAFRRGLAAYFARHAGGNATYRDFIAAMAEAAPGDWATWTRSWLETAGLNALAVRYECAGDRLARLELVQTAVSGPPLLRRHAASVALLAGPRLAAADVLRVEVAGAVTLVPAAAGRPCPRAVFPNHGDRGYFRTQLDERSAAALEGSIADVADPLLRQQLWAALWDRVRDGELDLLRFADVLIAAGLAREHDELILGPLIRTARDAIGYLRQSDALAASALPALPALAERIEREVWRRLEAAGPAPGARLVWLDALPTLTASPWGLGRIARLLDGGEPAAGPAPDQDRRWDLVAALARNAGPDAARYIAREAARDPSSLGQEKRIAATAALRGSWDEKLRWVDELERPRPAHSLAQVRAAVSQLFPDAQRDLRERFAARFFADLPRLGRDRGLAVATLFAELVPPECEPRTAGRIARFLAAHSGLPLAVRNRLRLEAQEGERCRRIVALAGRSAAAH